MIESEDHTERIRGAYKAGHSKDKKFVPYLLNDAYDFATSTNIKYKGISVYQAKMEALSDIYEVQPPIKITYKPDSLVIKFYTRLYENEMRSK